MENNSENSCRNSEFTSSSNDQFKSENTPISNVRQLVAQFERRSRGPLSSTITPNSSSSSLRSNLSSITSKKFGLIKNSTIKLQKFLLMKNFEQKYQTISTSTNNHRNNYCNNDRQKIVNHNVNNNIKMNFDDCVSKQNSLTNDDDDDYNEDDVYYDTKNNQNSTKNEESMTICDSLCSDDPNKSNQKTNVSFVETNINNTNNSQTTVEELLKNINDHYYPKDRNSDETNQVKHTNEVISSLCKLFSVMNRKQVPNFDQVSNVIECSRNDSDGQHQEQPQQSITNCSNNSVDQQQTSPQNRQSWIRGNEVLSGQEPMVIEEEKEESGDDFIYQQINKERELEQREEYRKFCDKLQSTVKQITGILVEDFNLSFDQFKQLVAKYGDCRLWEKDIQFVYQPQVIVLQSYNEINHDPNSVTGTMDNHGQNCSTAPDADTIKLQTQEIFIYPNELTFI